MGQPVFASPITYEAGGKQYVTIESSSDGLTSAIRAALDEFVRTGRTAFLSLHEEPRSVNVFVRWSEVGVLCDAAAVVRAAIAAQSDLPRIADPASGSS